MSVSEQSASVENKTQQPLLKFFTPTEKDWRCLEISTLDEKDEIEKSPSDKKDELEKIKFNNDALREMLLSALQMPNLVVLSGSGTSLGNVGGPSMWNLWDYAVNENAGASNSDPRTQTAEAELVINKISFNSLQEGENIEALLSRCEAWLQINDDDNEVSHFVKKSKAIILDKCQSFLKDNKLDAHCSFLRKLSRRSARNPRLKVFTTNYDLCFERAAALQNLIVVDGFSFSQPRTFNPLYFGYDIVRRSRLTEEHGDYLEGVFHLLKLHGSVNWEYIDGVIQEKKDPEPDKACLIYPARGKYQQSYLQPHLELVSQFFSSLREPNTCLIVAGFGFNDDHLSEPILAAVKSNPHLKLIVFDYCAENSTNGNNEKASRYWRELFKLANDDVDVSFLNADFEKFVSLIPDLKALSRAQKLEQAVLNSVKGRS